MSQSVLCPACGVEVLDLCRYDAMMVVSSQLAFFTLHCPRCDTVVSALYDIPPQLRDEVRLSAREVGAGMGRC